MEKSYFLFIFYHVDRIYNVVINSIDLITAISEFDCFIDKNNLEDKVLMQITIFHHLGELKCLEPSE